MKRFATLLLLASTTQAMGNTHCNDQCQSALINDYYAKINQAVIQDSTPENVENFLAVLHDDVTYLHEEYEAKFDKDIWRKAFLRQMDLGRYDDTIASNTQVISIIHGYQTAAVEFVSRYRNRDDADFNSSPTRLAIFKFKDNKIVFIQDHWYHIAEQAPAQNQ